MTEGNKSLGTELLKEEIEQLHSAILKISDSCFEYKKLCVALVGLLLPILLKLTSDKLDYSFFLVGLGLVLGFWFADANAYFYQKNLRVLMDGIKNRLGDGQVGWLELPIKKASKKDSFFNYSMTLYAYLFMFIIISMLLFHYGLIGHGK